MFKKSEDCNKALMRIVPRIHMEEIQNFLQEVPYLSHLQHTFYQSYNSSLAEKQHKISHTRYRTVNIYI